MVTPQFKQAYQKLNQAQKKAVDTIEGSVMVVAGPGTGKTQILTLRIAKILLETQINPGNILALTFTDSAVLAMRKRLVETIGSEGYKVEINTFHGFCNEIIRRNPEEFPDFLTFDSITEIDQIQILENILTETKLEFLKPFGEPYYYLKSILSAINDLKKENVSPEILSEAVIKWKSDFDEIEDLFHQKGEYAGVMKGKYQIILKNVNKNFELTLLYQKYQAELKKLKSYDFNDMLLEVIKALAKNRELRLRLQEMYQYILVDEHQDTNTAQNRLIEILASFHPNPNLFVVGDEKQAIYRFQGASLENFLYFKKLYPEAILIDLEENYRSTQTILNAADSLISQNITSKLLLPQKKLKSKVVHNEEKIKIVGLNDYYAEYYFLAKDIAAKIKAGIKPGEIAVFGRNNRDLLPVIEAFEQNKVAFNLESDQDIVSDPNIQKLITLFKAVEKFGEDRFLIDTLHADFWYVDPLDVYKLIKYASSAKKSVYDILESGSFVIPTKTGSYLNRSRIKPPLASLAFSGYGMTQSGKENLLQKSGVANPNKLIQIYAKLKNYKTLSKNENIETLFVTILNDSGLLEYCLKKPDSLELLDKLAGFYEDIKSQTNKKPELKLIELLNYLELLKSHELIVKKPVKVTLKDSIRVMTAHKSKGLEFDYVYIIQAFDGHWGNARKHIKGLEPPWDYLGITPDLSIELEQNEDERRLFYVCLTRARKGATICYSTRSLEGKEQVPSQFISEIDAEHKEAVVTDHFEATFLAQRELIFAPRVNTGLTLHHSSDLSVLKEYFQSLFLEKGLSATGLNNYLSCPWKFFYRDLIHLPEEKNKNMIFGLAIHKSINEYVRVRKFKSPTEKYLLEAFDKALRKETDSEKLVFKELQDKGEKMLRGFYQQEISKWPKNMQSELVIKGVSIKNNIVINGRLDLIEPLDNSGKYRVYDFKTGKPQTRNQIEGLTKNATGDYKRQLVFYKILLDRHSNGRMNMAEGVIEFLEPDAKGKYHKEIFLIGTDQTKKLEEQILQVSDEIINLGFWNKRCNDKECRYCNLRDTMAR